MYEAYYGLTRRPFSKTPDPAFLYEGEVHAEALARLLLAVEERELCLFTGEIGAGKTTLSRALVDRLDARHRVALIINPRLSAAQLLETVAEQLGVDPLPKGKLRLLDALTEQLYRYHTEGAVPLIIVDEAQLIPSKSVFEELRLLTNLQLDDTPLVGLLLMGQPELRTKLSRATYRSFLQRVGVAYHLGPLDAESTAAYVAHRLVVAGRTDPLFTDDALLAIHGATGGIPRRINTVCQSALLVGYGHQRPLIDRRVIDEVLEDLSRHLGAIFPAPKSPAPLSMSGEGSF